ncbi:hypothetical protein B0A49_13491, partial [Cryomyces minteri]
MCAGCRVSKPSSLSGASDVSDGDLNQHGAPFGEAEQSSDEPQRPVCLLEADDEKEGNHGKEWQDAGTDVRLSHSIH